MVWSPEDPNGLPLANVLARHFDNAEEAREFGGIRIPVFVRYEAFATASTAPRPIDLDEAEHNLIVVIGTHHLPTGWPMTRRGRIGSTSSARNLATGPERQIRRHFAGPSVLEVRASPAATRFGPISGRPICKARFPNHLLLFSRICAGRCYWKAPARRSRRSSAPQAAAVHQSRQAGWRRRRGPHPDAARRDGFWHRTLVDANDLTGGEMFTEELEAEIADATLLAIHTDAYGSRPFCRWEILRANFIADRSTSCTGSSRAKVGSFLTAAMRR